MIAEIDRAREAGDTMGGSFEVIAHDVPPGLGSYVQWDRKLDGRLAQALMSIPAIKAVGIGRGPAVAVPAGLAHPRRDSAAAGRRAGRHCRRHPADQQRRRPRRRRHQRRGPADHRLHETDRDADEAAALVDLTTLEESPAAIERSDVCAVPAAAVVGRGDGRDRPRRRGDRKIRRRFDDRAGRQLAGLPGAHGCALHPRKCTRRTTQERRDPQSSQSAIFATPTTAQRCSRRSARIEARDVAATCMRRQVR